MQGQSKDSVGTVPGPYGYIAETLLEQCEDSVGTVLERCKDSAEKVGDQCKDSSGTVPV